MKQTYENAIKIINGSKIFSFDGPVLEIKSYRTGESVKLDLSKLTPEMFEELKKEEPRRAVWLRCKENIEGWDERTSRALGAIDRNRCSLLQADARLADQISDQMQEYCWDEGIDYDDLDFVPEDILFYVDD